MTLAPKLPPGRANRKALQFAVDIHRLRNAGYTFSAIRAALFDAGMSVSLSTIKREASRIEGSALPAQQSGVMPRSPMTSAPTTSGHDVPPARPLVPTGTSGRESAEAFFNAHPSNPLFRTKETS
jgi:hypothetical protein